MFLKYFREPYYEAPNSGSGGGSGDSDVDILDSDSNNDDETSQNERIRSKKTEPDTKRKAVDSEDTEDRDEKEEETTKKHEFGSEFESKESEKEDEEDETSLDSDDDEDDDEDTDKSESESEEESVENEFTVRALKKEFPKIFQKFPEVKDAIFREREFTRIFGSVEEAHEAGIKAQYLDEISEELFQGKSDNLLKSLKKNNEQSLKVFAGNFLPELHKIDKELHTQITDQIINQALHVAASYAQKRENKNLGYAVKYLAEFIFGDTELPELKEIARPKEPSAEEIALQRREQAHEQRKYNEFEEGIHSSARRRLEEFVNEGLDPDGALTSFTKEAIADKIIEKTGMIISQDKFFQSKLASFWRNARKENYSKEAKSRIISAYLARAKKIVPSVRAQVRKDATGRNKNIDTDNNGDRNTGKRQGTSTSSGKRQSSIPNNPKKINYDQVSDLDILNQD